MLHKCSAAVLASLVCVTAPAFADETGSEQPDSNQIVVNGRAIAQIGIATSGSEGTVGFDDFEDRPLSRVGELAENVPGLIATQHSGSGKANQYFLRGFNLDHGTDLAGYVDGAPVNMRSHGHGQGYLDLNFLIPELVERIDYSKGPYHAADGDFASAGSLRFSTKARLPEPIAEVTGGSWGYWRGLAAGSGEVGQGTLLAAVEGVRTNGPWVLNERLRKLNALLKYSAAHWSIGLSGYESSWRSTDQVPERAIAAGVISRLGYIDPDLGGRAGRLALTFNGTVGDTTFSAYAIASRLQLTSNFTYFLENPVEGDQFRQIDRRGVFGGSLVHRVDSGDIVWTIGGDARWDRIGKLGLYRTVSAVPQATVRQDRVDEYGGGMFTEAELSPAQGLRVVLGLRGDAIGYRVRSDSLANSGRGSAGIITPKIALAWQAQKGLEFYANYGEGYHSNDVRGATISVDPASGAAADRVPVFARSRGAELGMRVERPGLSVALVGFWLDLASELVFVGDAGSTEPNDASRRFGSELSLFWRPAHWLTLDGSAAWTRARFRGVDPAQDRIPGATPFVLAAGVSADLAHGLTATMRVRHFAAAPLIEDNSKQSRQTTLMNLGVYWQRGAVRLGVDVLNLLNAKDPDISYYYASRLQGEPAEGVEDRHIHPVEPRQARVSLRYSF